VFTFLSGLSLLLCVATVLLEARSQTVRDQVLAAARGGRLRWVESADGRVTLVSVGQWPYSEPLQHSDRADWFAGGRYHTVRPSAREWSGFGVRMVHGVGEVKVWTKGPPFMKDGETAVVMDVLRQSRWHGGASVSLGPVGNRGTGWWASHDFGDVFQVTSPPMPMWAVSIGHGLAAAVFAVPPAAWMLLAARRAVAARRRAERGLCTGCGYDLRGNASGVCPECGAALGATGRPRGDAGAFEGGASAR
jgi:hypothetical protein